MQINGRLQLQLTLSDKDYIIKGSVKLDEQQESLDRRADEIATRIMAKVRQRSQARLQAKSATKLTSKFEQQEPLSIKVNDQTTNSQAQPETVKHIRMGTLEVESGNNQFYNVPPLRPASTMMYERELGSNCQSLHSKLREDNNTPNDMKTPIKSKSISSNNFKREGTIKKTQKQQPSNNYYLVNEQPKQEGKQLIKMIDTVHNLVKKSSTFQMARVGSPSKQQVTMDSTKSSKPSNLQTPVQKQYHKSDVVSQLLGSLRHAKRAKDDFSKKYM